MFVIEGAYTTEVRRSIRKPVRFKTFWFLSPAAEGCSKIRRHKEAANAARIADPARGCSSHAGKTQRLLYLQGGAGIVPRTYYKQ